MEKLFESGTASSLLAGILAMTALQLVRGMAEFLWKMREKKDAVTESGIHHLSAAMQKNTAATESLEGRIKNLETTIGDVSRLKSEMRRLFHVVKVLTGDRWPQVKKAAASDQERSGPL